MPFRILVIGPPLFRDYPRLRDILDVVLANRIPDVELLTVGGSGLPSLVASYARMRVSWNFGTPAPCLAEARKLLKLFYNQVSLALLLNDGQFILPILDHHFKDCFLDVLNFAIHL